MHWQNIFEYDDEGEEFISFLQETSDRTQWGGANQMAMFAKLENIKIKVYRRGMPCQIYDFQGNDEINNKTTISVLWRNINRWGAQENHYDLLIPI
eukprot:2956353-Heterocapsa_arctica.AAC.1